MESDKPRDPYPEANPDLIPESDHNGNEPNPSGHNRSNRSEAGNDARPSESTANTVRHSGQ